MTPSLLLSVLRDLCSARDTHADLRVVMPAHAAEQQLTLDFKITTRTRDDVAQHHINVVCLLQVGARDVVHFNYSQDSREHPATAASVVTRMIEKDLSRWF